MLAMTRLGTGVGPKARASGRQEVKSCRLHAFQARFHRELPTWDCSLGHIDSARLHAGCAALEQSGKWLYHLHSPHYFSSRFWSIEHLCFYGRSPCTQWMGFRGPSSVTLTRWETSREWGCQEQPGTSAEMWLKPQDQCQK